MKIENIYGDEYIITKNPDYCGDCTKCREKCRFGLEHMSAVQNEIFVRYE